MENIQNPLLSKNAKKFLALTFFVFFILLAKFTPYDGTVSTPSSFTGQIFSLYFFIISQTLGIVHEGGHGICYIFHCPEFITAANGTVFQLLFPFLIGYYYKRKGNIFAFLIGLFFLGFSLQYSAWYISTAHYGLLLPASKSFLGVDTMHDFNYILTQMHLLKYNSIISLLVAFTAYCIMIYSVGYMLLLAFFSSAKKKKRSLKIKS